MSREFSKVSPKVWRSNRFRALPSDDARYLLLFVLTSPHQTSAGCFKMPDAYGSADMNWTVERFLAARLELVQANLLAFDEATDEYYLPGWLSFNKPMNASHQKAIVRLVADIESDVVREIAEAELMPALIPSTVETIPNRSALASTSYFTRRAG